MSKSVTGETSALLSNDIQDITSHNATNPDPLKNETQLQNNSLTNVPVNTNKNTTGISLKNGHIFIA